MEVLLEATRAATQGRRLRLLGLAASARPTAKLPPAHLRDLFDRAATAGKALQRVPHVRPPVSRSDTSPRPPVCKGRVNGAYTIKVQPAYACVKRACKRRVYTQSAAGVRNRKSGV